MDVKRHLNNNPASWSHHFFYLFVDSHYLFSSEWYASKMCQNELESIVYLPQNCASRDFTTKKESLQL
jgi:hypothetical protein